LKAEVAADIRAIFNAANRYDAEVLLAQVLQKYSPKASKLWSFQQITMGPTTRGNSRWILGEPGASDWRKPD
jgi:hypothetical protein